MKTQVILSWSGGKDSAAAPWELQKGGEYEVVALLASISQEYRRISHHGVREDAAQQAGASAFPWRRFTSRRARDSRAAMRSTRKSWGGDGQVPRQGVRAVAFGDRSSKTCGRGGKRIWPGRAWRIFPIWKRDTSEFARTIIARATKRISRVWRGRGGRGLSAGRTIRRCCAICRRHRSVRRIWRVPFLRL